MLYIKELKQESRFAAANSFTSAAFPYWFPLTYNLVQRSLLPQNLEQANIFAHLCWLQIRLRRLNLVLLHPKG
jgi:hypothetical protein